MKKVYIAFVGQACVGEWALSWAPVGCANDNSALSLRREDLPGAAHCSRHLHRPVPRYDIITTIPGYTPSPYPFSAASLVVTASEAVLQDEADPSGGLHLTMMDVPGTFSTAALAASLAGMHGVAVCYAVDDPQSFQAAVSTVSAPPACLTAWTLHHA